MLAPHNTADFFAQHFEKLPLHVERNDPAYFADVYSVADVEDSLVVGAREPENFALVKAGSSEVRHVLSRFFGDSREKLMLSLLGDSDVTPEELQRLREAIQRAE